jgi:outer membrane lipoprotein-sorting protein
MKRVAFVLLMLVALVSLLAGACGGGGEQGEATPTPTPTPTPTSTATVTPTPTAALTPTPTSTSASGQTLGDIYGVGTQIRDVQFDQVMTAPGQLQTTMKVYWKNWGSNTMKYRSEMTTGGQETVQIIDYAAQTMYSYIPAQSIAYKMSFGQAPENPTENSDQIKPTYVGTETIDGKLCDVWQYTISDTSTKVWVWKAESFPIRMESTTSSGTVIVEYKNIVFGTLSNDLFQLPAGVQIIEFPIPT